MLALSVAACTGGEQARDAASEPRPEGTPVRIAPEPGLAVGTLQGDSAEQFYDVATPFLLPDGKLAVPVAGANEIRVFDRSGELTRTLGGPGEGPGEFVRLQSAWARGDTIEAYDYEQRRITRFFPGDSIEAIRLEGVASAHNVLPGTLGPGWASMSVASAGLGRRDTVAVHRFGPNGTHRGELARVIGYSRYRVPGGGGPDPLSPRAVFAVHDGAVYVAETRTPRVRVLTPAGSLDREITWDPGELPAPGEAFEVTVSAVAAAAPPEDSARTRRRLQAFPVPDQVNAFWSLLVDEEGFVWVEPYRPAKHSLALTGPRGTGPGSRWIVFSSEGERVGTVTLPDELSPVRITSDAVVGIRRNELGVEFVQVHPLERR